MAGQSSEIRIRGAREHNLRNIDLEVPHDRLVVFTGVSGSGKSSLIYETLFRESQRRHLASLPPHVRSAFTRLTRPKVDRIDGLRPAIAIQRQGIRSGPRSTVGTATEIVDYLALLYARCGDGVSPGRDDLDPRVFLPTSRLGACPACAGAGERDQVDLERLIPDPSRSIAEGAFATTTPTRYVRYSRLARPGWVMLANVLGFSLDDPWESLTEGQQHAILHGDKALRQASSLLSDFAGLVPTIEAAYKRSRTGLARPYVKTVVCPDCGGTRFNPEALVISLAGISIAEVWRMSVSECLDFCRGLEFDGTDAQVAAPIIEELARRAELVRELGLGYLPLNRSTTTLSGGEAQRVRLAGQVSAGISGVLYILDEPSIGLHHRDHGRLLSVLARLRDAGNTLCVAEHDRATIASADHIVDLGPGPAEKGGRVVVAGTPAEMMACRQSLTGDYLAGRRRVALESRQRPADGPALVVRGARHRNLKRIDVRFPLGTLTCVTGVSGSGKSTLVHGILRPALSKILTRGRFSRPVGEHDALEGHESVRRVIEIDQSPIGRSPRSNPATYTRAFDAIRNAFAKTPEAQIRGFGPGHFSFNVPGGRCEACSGAGVVRVPMQYVPDVFVECEECEGHRFTREVLRIRYHGVNIAQVLEQSAAQALEVFGSLPPVRRALDALCDVGLDYIRLGQPGTSLSGGEAQRVRLAAHVAKSGIGHTVFLLDEPTTGLHLADVERLLGLLQRLVDDGNTVLVIEHHPDVIRASDWIIDLGPEGGADGGELVAIGPPESLAAMGRGKGCASHTARLLAHGEDAVTLPPPALAQEDGAATARWLQVRGARANNLQSVDVDIPKGQITCVTGVSGSGKSSLVFDTIYAACQTSFAHCLSSFARRALGRIRSPEATSVEGICPAVAVNRRSRAASARSTVGTSTEILQLMRMLWARVGARHCPECQKPVDPLSGEQIADLILQSTDGNFVQLVAPLARGLRRREEVHELARDLKSAGFSRVRVNGQPYNLSHEEIEFGKKRKHDVDCLVDRLRPSAERRERLVESVQLALNLSGTELVCEVLSNGSVESSEPYSAAVQCPDCRVGLEPELTPRHFSFNNPLGRCPRCKGLGTTRAFDRGLLVPELSLSFSEGALAPLTRAQYANAHSDWSRVFEALGRAFGFGRTTPFCELTPRQMQVVLHGLEDKRLTVHGVRENGRPARRRWKGLIPLLVRAGQKDPRRAKALRRYMTSVTCEACEGERLRPEFRAARVGGLRLPEVWGLTLKQALGFLRDLELPPTEAQTAAGLLAELRGRLEFLNGVGLGYVELGREIRTLSAGEAQRVRLAAQLGGTLSGLLYVLDEPSVGLHPHDMDSLLFALQGLKDLGNTVIAIEHDEATMSRADYLIELGPGPGRQGGKVLREGPRDKVLPKLLNDRPGLQRRTSSRTPSRRGLRLVEARHNNLRNVSVTLPLRALTTVTGVSGAGKSSLLFDVIQRALQRRLQGYGQPPGAHSAIEGAQAIDQVTVVDQTGVGTSPRSVPATYVGFFDAIRELFASEPAAREKGFTRAHFSFNDAKGRCKTCQGDGVRQVDMQFMADLVFECEDCDGRRYSNQILRIRHCGKTIADVLSMTFDEAAAFFARDQEIAVPIAAVCRAGLGYLTLGQPSSSLSGGESQRLKLASALARPAQGHVLYLMDEPTTGLHARDVAALIRVLHQLADSGATVAVIEHNLDVVAASDHIIDLGPGGGPNGGSVVVEGTPAAIVACARSRTGQYLREHLERAEPEGGSAG